MFRTKPDFCTIYFNPRKCSGLFYPHSLSKLLASRSNYRNTNSSFFAPSRPYGRHLRNSQTGLLHTLPTKDTGSTVPVSMEGRTDVRLSPNPAMWRFTPRRTQLPKCKLRTTEIGHSGPAWNPGTGKIEARELPVGSRPD